MPCQHLRLKPSRACAPRASSIVRPPHAPMLYPMFTGIVERSIRVASVSDGTGFRRLNLAVDWPDAKRGESVAVNGVCLTIAELSRGLLAFDVVPETLSKTNL